MRRSVWTDSGLQIEDVDPPRLPDGWARLQVEACGICGTDLHFWHGQLPRQVGTSPGHEFVGTVLDAPAGLADERYAACPLVSCGQCEYCVTGAVQLCQRGGPWLGLGRDGGLAEFVDVPLGNLWPVDSSVSALVASLAEPLAVVVRGVRLADALPQSRVLVLGAGIIGLITALVVRDRAADIAISARYPHQQVAAEALGVTVLSEGDVIAWSKEHRPDIVIETVGGTADTLDVATVAARRGARIVVLGTFDRTSLDFRRVLMKELTLTASYAYGTSPLGPEFKGAVDLLPRWAGELAGLQTHQFPLSSVNDAFTTASDKTSGALKITVVP